MPADAAADAAVQIDPGPVLILIEDDRRTFELLDACPTADAFFGDPHPVCGLGGAGFAVYNTGVFRDHYGNAALRGTNVGVRIPERSLNLRNIVGFNLPEA